MLSVERKAQIKDIVMEKKSVTVTDLAKKFNVTEETIRRDLKSLEENGVLNRTYGGAYIVDGVINDIKASIRETIFNESKTNIAKISAELINHGDSIFLDSSTTACFICNEIPNKRLTVITNSLLAVNRLKDNPNISLIAIGGAFNSTRMSFEGKSAILALERYFVDKAFLSCRSLSIEHGITDASEGSAEIRQLMLDHAKEVYLVADNTKFGKTSFVTIGNFDKIKAVIVDQTLSSEWHSFFEKKNIKLYEHRK
ncbi:MAG: DeoR family transcriptional regulator [Clostridiales bacterium GWC2_40_7]|nr:MAG: DeoR family transcriptional regulator [Clostridiales bacterium GWC2_40_7]